MIPVAGILIVLLALLTMRSPAAERPNILFLFADDQRADCSVVPALAVE